MLQFARLALLCVIVSFAPGPAVACTIFSCIAQNGHVWNANNEDGRRNPDNVYLNVYPRKPGSRFGYVTLTHDTADTPDIQGGMNEAGLTFDFNALGREYPVKNREAKRSFPMRDEQVIPYVLANFHTAEEVVAFFDKHWFASDEIFTSSQMHIADKHGHFAIVGPSGNRLSKDASFQVSTNFNICDDQDGSSCWRYPIVSQGLGKTPVSLGLLTKLCAKTAQQGSIKTVYSNIQNLNTGDIWFFYNQAYGSPFKTNIHKLLEGGRKSYSVRELCMGPPNAAHSKRRISGWLRDYKVPAAAVAIIDPGEQGASWVEAFGERIPGYPATVDTVFNVASLTKPVFGMMALQLIANGEIGLDSSLQEHWIDPDIAANEWHRKLTPRILLSHQSGFPNWREGKLAFQFEPGTKTGYSGEGIDYLRKAIELKTGSKMTALMEEHVLNHAGMRHTSFGWKESIVTRFAPGHEWSASEGKFRVEELRGLADRVPSGAGSMFSTIGDYAKFVEWVLAGAELPKSLQKEMRTPQGRALDTETIGLAWHLVPDDHETILYHEGRETGVYALCVIQPKTRKALVILTNGNNGELLAKRIVEGLFPNGRQFVQAKSHELWKTLRAMTGGQLAEVIPVLAQSPTYMDSVFAAMGLASRMDRDRLGDAEGVFHQFISGMIGGDVNRDAAERVLNQLVEKRVEQPKFVSAITPAIFERIVEMARRETSRGMKAGSTSSSE